MLPNLSNVRLSLTAFRRFLLGTTSPRMHRAYYDPFDSNYVWPSWRIDKWPRAAFTAADREAYDKANEEAWKGAFDGVPEEDQWKITGSYR